jgi:hypothetical protein
MKLCPLMRRKWRRVQQPWCSWINCRIMRRTCLADDVNDFKYKTEKQLSWWKTFSYFALLLPLIVFLLCTFLVSCTQLYTSLCWSVGRLVGPSVHPKSIRFFRRLELKGYQIWVTAPAHPHATDAAAYTALFSYFALLLPHIAFLLRTFFSYFAPLLHVNALWTFLDLSTNLYKRVCPSVRPSVGPSIGWSIRPSVSRSRVFFKSRKSANLTNLNLQIWQIWQNLTESGKSLLEIQS